jgi:hypothetical protein
VDIAYQQWVHLGGRWRTASSLIINIHFDLICPFYYRVDFVDFRVDFVDFRVDFVDFHVDFVDFHVDFVDFRVDFVDFHVDFVDFHVDFVDFRVDFFSSKMFKCPQCEYTNPNYKTVHQHYRRNHREVPFVRGSIQQLNQPPIPQPVLCY